MKKNNFQQLQDEQERAISPHQHHQIRKIEGGIVHSLRLFRFVGNIFNIYFPDFARTIVGSSTSQQTLDSDLFTDSLPSNNDPASLGGPNWQDHDLRKK